MSRDYGTFRFPGGTYVVVANRQVTTWLPCGCCVDATPNNSPEDVARATALGYQGDVWAMTVDHDLAHSFLAHIAGRSWSRVLWAQAHPDVCQPFTPEERAHEEARVLDFQQVLAVTDGRPWDVYEVNA